MELVVVDFGDWVNSFERAYGRSEILRTRVFVYPIYDLLSFSVVLIRSRLKELTPTAKIDRLCY